MTIVTRPLWGAIACGPPWTLIGGDRDFGNLPARVDDEKEFGSLVVAQNGDQIASLDCRSSSIIWNGNALFQSMDAAGLKWHLGRRGYFEWHDDRIYPYSGLPTNVPPFFCPYRDEFPIEIVGQDCDTAEVILTITTLAGEVVHSSSALALSYTYEFQGADGVRAMLINFMKNLPRSGNDLPPYEEMQDGSGHHRVNGLLVRRARSLNLPLFCHQAGKSFIECVIYANGKSQLLFGEGS
ncbi:MAG: hypothetical protein ACI93B_001851 [Yoonia sp.]